MHSSASRSPRVSQVKLPSWVVDAPTPRGRSASAAAPTTMAAAQPSARKKPPTRDEYDEHQRSQYADQEAVDSYLPPTQRSSGRPSISLVDSPSGSPTANSHHLQTRRASSPRVLPSSYSSPRDHSSPVATRPSSRPGTTFPATRPATTSRTTRAAQSLSASPTHMAGRALAPREKEQCFPYGNADVKASLASFAHVTFSAGSLRALFPSLSLGDVQCEMARALSERPGMTSRQKQASQYELVQRVIELLGGAAERKREWDMHRLGIPPLPSPNASMASGSNSPYAPNTTALSRPSASHNGLGSPSRSGHTHVSWPGGGQMSPAAAGQQNHAAASSILAHSMTLADERAAYAAQLARESQQTFHGTQVRPSNAVGGRKSWHASVTGGVRSRFGHGASAFPDAYGYYHNGSPSVAPPSYWSVERDEKEDASWGGPRSAVGTSPSAWSLYPPRGPFRPRAGSADDATNGSHGTSPREHGSGRTKSTIQPPDEGADESLRRQWSEDPLHGISFSTDAIPMSSLPEVRFRTDYHDSLLESFDLAAMALQRDLRAFVEQLGESLAIDTRRQHHAVQQRTQPPAQPAASVVAAAQPTDAAALATVADQQQPSGESTLVGDPSGESKAVSQPSDESLLVRPQSGDASVASRASGVVHPYLLNFVSRVIHALPKRLAGVVEQARSELITFGREHEEEGRVDPTKVCEVKDAEGQIELCQQTFVPRSLLQTLESYVASLKEQAKKLMRECTSGMREALTSTFPYPKKTREDAAATRIQSLVRGSIIRRRIHSQKNSRADSLEFNRQHGSPPSTRRPMRSTGPRPDHVPPEYHRAAEKIQARAKGMLVRRKMKATARQRNGNARRRRSVHNHPGRASEQPTIGTQTDANGNPVEDDPLAPPSAAQLHENGRVSLGTSMDEAESYEIEPSAQATATPADDGETPPSATAGPETASLQSQTGKQMQDGATQTDEADFASADAPEEDDEARRLAMWAAYYEQQKREVEAAIQIQRIARGTAARARVRAMRAARAAGQEFGLASTADGLHSSIGSVTRRLPNEHNSVPHPVLIEYLSQASCALLLYPSEVAYHDTKEMLTACAAGGAHNASHPSTLELCMQYLDQLRAKGLHCEHPSELTAELAALRKEEAARERLLQEYIARAHLLPSRAKLSLGGLAHLRTLLPRTLVAFRIVRIAALDALKQQKQREKEREAEDQAIENQFSPRGPPKPTQPQAVFESEEQLLHAVEARRQEGLEQLYRHLTEHVAAVAADAVTAGHPLAEYFTDLAESTLPWADVESMWYVGEGCASCVAAYWLPSVLARFAGSDLPQESVKELVSVSALAVHMHRYLEQHDVRVQEVTKLVAEMHILPMPQPLAYTLAYVAPPKTMLDHMRPGHQQKASIGGGATAAPAGGAPPKRGHHKTQSFLFPMSSPSADSGLDWQESEVPEAPEHAHAPLLEGDRPPPRACAHTLHALARLDARLRAEAARAAKKRKSLNAQTPMPSLPSDALSPRNHKNMLLSPRTGGGGGASASVGSVSVQPVSAGPEAATDLRSLFESFARATTVRPVFDNEAALMKAVHKARAPKPVQTVTHGLNVSRASTPTASLTNRRGSTTPSTFHRTSSIVQSDAMMPFSPATKKRQAMGTRRSLMRPMPIVVVPAHRDSSQPNTPESQRGHKHALPSYGALDDYTLALAADAMKAEAEELAAYRMQASHLEGQMQEEPAAAEAELEARMP